MKYAGILGFAAGVSLFCASAAAAPIFLTVSETENGQTEAWWPNRPGSDRAIQMSFEQQGIAVMHPEKMTNAPRLSPVVYGQKPLSNDNARTLASLFGAENVLNGDVKWSCRATDQKAECEADASLTLIYKKNEKLDLSRKLRASAKDEATAKKYAMTKLVSELVLPIASRTSASTDGVPALIDKPVIIFDPIPDADTLVALRRQLKRVPGVTDVAERWVSNGKLAIEVNPEQRQMTVSEFSSIIQGFMNENAENLVIRKTRMTDMAAVFEVVKF